MCLTGLVYCMDYLEKNIDWLQARLAPLLKGWYKYNASVFSLRLVDQSISNLP